MTSSLLPAAGIGAVIGAAVRYFTAPPHAPKTDVMWFAGIGAAGAALYAVFRRPAPGHEFVGGIPPTRFYGGITEGALLDIVDDMRRAGGQCSEDRPFACVGWGFRFRLLHDPDDVLRAVAESTDNLSALWARIDRFVGPRQRQDVTGYGGYGGYSGYAALGGDCGCT